MPLHTRACELFGIEHPLFAFTPSAEVVVAVSRAGGLGVLGAVRFANGRELDEALDWIDAHVDGRPYGVDVVMPAKSAGDGPLPDLEAMIDPRHRAFVDEILARHGVAPLPPDAPRPQAITAWMDSYARELVDVSLRHPIRLIANALGSPPPDVVAQAHAKGVKVAALAGTAKHAKKHADAGVDVVIAQGHEAGGHTGEVTTMVLVPEVVAAVSPVPVLAAGGIGTGAQLAAALALGADGGWLGSVWLTASEFQLEPKTERGMSIVQEKLVAATSSDTVRSRVVSGKPARMLKTPWTEAWIEAGSPGTLPMPLQGLLVAEAEARIRHHQVRDLLGTPVGQIVGQMNAMRPAGEIVAEIVRDAEATLARLAKLVSR
jgi:NAD(P)H-dependent flavin oxidoreductase YrpB (nitropropane dioxygenase family)